MVARILGLDLSAASTGYACWGPGDDSVRSGRWVLLSDIIGGAFVTLHRRMMELYEELPFDVIYVEDTLNVGSLAGHTNITTLKMLSGLNAHAKSFGCAMGIRHIVEVNQKSWRKTFLGTVPLTTKTVWLKNMAVERCQQLAYCIGLLEGRIKPEDVSVTRQDNRHPVMDIDA